MLKHKLNTIFFIYTEASAALFFMACAILEFVCAAMINGPFQLLALGAGIAFTCIACSMAAYVYCSAKRTNII